MQGLWIYCKIVIYTTVKCFFRLLNKAEEKIMFISR